MAASAQYTAGTVATLVVAAPPRGVACPVGWWYLTNGTGATIYLGGVNVTSSNGAQVAASATLTGFVFGSDSIYACTGSGTSTVGVLQAGL